MEPPHSDHIRIDERSLALHKLVADKVRNAPILLEKVKENLRRWRASRDGSPALGEWEEILVASTDQLITLLAERSERAARLRQSSPFAGILTEEERRAIYESYSARTYNSRSEPNLG